MNYRESLAGFHNPYLHKNLTPEEFLKKWIISQKKKYNRPDGWKRKKLVKWVEKNWENQIKFVSRLFPSTLKINRKKK